MWFGVMERMKLLRGVVPERIKVDNGSEFISKALDKWAYENKVTLDFSRPGKPTDNAFIESFNGSFRRRMFERQLVLIFGRCEGENSGFQGRI